MKTKPILVLVALSLWLCTGVANAQEAVPFAAGKDIPVAGQPGSLLGLTSVWNTRDMGGYATPNNKAVRSGLIFRSGDLSTLDEADRKQLEEMGIKTIVDLRLNQEKVPYPDIPPATVKMIRFISIWPEAFRHLTEESPLEDIHQGMFVFNEILIKRRQAEYREFFEVISNPENLPLIFHCTAGKDRAGMAAALFLGAMGADRETILRDYELSAIYVEPRYRDDTAKKPNMAPLNSVDRVYMAHALDIIDKEYGGMEAYLSNCLGVDLPRIRQIYLKNRMY